MDGMVEVPISDFFPPTRSDDFSGSTFTGPEYMLKRIAFTARPMLGRVATYNIILSDRNFRGKLDFLLGPGEGEIRIDGAGSINASFRLYRRVSIRIGEGTTINGSQIVCDNADIIVGRNGLWSGDVLIQSNDQHGIIDLATMKPLKTGRRKTIIGEHVWVGRRAMIMPDVEIGREAIIAAGACVTSNVDRNCIFAGVPARKVREGITWSRSPTGLSNFEQDFLGYRS